MSDATPLTAFAIDEKYRAQQRVLQSVFHAEAIRSAVLTMYDARSPEGARAAADAFLQEFLGAGSTVVLAPCGELLSETTGKSSAVHIFAAQALHRTLAHCVIVAVARQRSHVQFDVGEWTALRARLVDLTRAFVRERAVLTQLALSLAALALKMPTWPPESVVADLVEALLIQGGEPAAAVEVLRVLCEEVDNVKMHPDRRKLHIECQARDAPLALEAIARAAEASPDLVGSHVALEAATPWLAKLLPGSQQQQARRFVLAACKTLSVGGERSAEAASAAIQAALENGDTFASLVAEHAGLNRLLLGDADDAKRRRALAASVFALLVKLGSTTALGVLLEAHRLHALESDFSYALAEAFDFLREHEAVPAASVFFASTLASQLTALCFEADLDGVGDEAQDRLVERDLLIDALRDAASCALAPVTAVVCGALRTATPAPGLACARTIFKVATDADLAIATTEACRRHHDDERGALLSCAAVSALALSRRFAITTELAGIAAHFASKGCSLVVARAGIVALMHLCEATEDASVVQAALTAAALPLYTTRDLKEAPRRHGQESVRLIALRCLALHAQQDDALNVLTGITTSCTGAVDPLLDAAVLASSARRRGRLFRDGTDEALALCTQCCNLILSPPAPQEEEEEECTPVLAATHAIFATLAPGWKDSSRRRFSEQLLAMQQPLPAFCSAELRCFEVVASTAAAGLENAAAGLENSRDVDLTPTVLLVHLILALGCHDEKRAPRALSLLESTLQTVLSLGGERLMLLNESASELLEAVRTGLRLACSCSQPEWTAGAQRSALQLATSLFAVGVAGEDATSTIMLARDVAAGSEDPATRTAALNALLEAASRAKIPSSSIATLAEALLFLARSRPQTFEPECLAVLDHLQVKNAQRDLKTLIDALEKSPAEASRIFKKTVKALCGGKRKSNPAAVIN